MAEERELRIRYSADYEDARRALDELEAQADKINAKTIGGPNEVRGPGVKRWEKGSSLGEHYETKYENRMVADLQRAQRDNDQKSKALEREMEKAASALASAAAADERRAVAANRAAARLDEANSKRAEAYETKYENRQVADRQRADREVESERVAQSKFTRDRGREALQDHREKQRGWDKDHESMERAARGLQPLTGSRTIRAAQQASQRQGEQASREHERNRVSRLHRQRNSGRGEVGRTRQERESLAKDLRSRRSGRGGIKGAANRFLGLRPGRLQQYMTYGFIGAQLGHAFNSFQHYQSETAIAEYQGSQLGKIKAEQKYTQTIRDVPIFGPLASMGIEAVDYLRYKAGEKGMTYHGTQAEADLAVARMEYQQKSLETATQAAGRVGVNVTQGQSSRERSSVLGGELRGSVDRQLAELSMKPRQLMQEANAKDAAELAMVNAVPDTATRDLRMVEYQANRTILKNTTEASIVQAKAQARRIQLDDQLVQGNMSGRWKGFSERMSGRVGFAAEREFEQGLIESERNAYATSSGQGNIQQILNSWARGARREEKRETVREIRSQIQQTDQLLDRRPDLAKFDEIREERRMGRRNARSEAEKEAVDELAEKKWKLWDRTYNESQQMQLQKTQQEGAVVNLEALGKEKTAHALDIFNQATMAAKAADLEGGPLVKEKQRAALELGLAQEKLFKRHLDFELYGGKFSGEIAPGGIGPGMLSSRPREEKISEGLEAVKQKIQDLADALLGIQ